VSGRLPSPRYDLVCVTVNGRTIVIGGYHGTTLAVADILVSRGGHHWGVLGRLRVPVRYAATGVADGAIWVFGGERNGAMVDAVQRVDLGTGRVRVAARLPHPLGHATAVAVARRILVIAGRTSSTRMTGRMWWFDPGHRDFRAAGRLRTPLADAAVVTTGRAAYLVGGETPC
jgi:N-acetylneuraminic acid mutarotase